MLASFILSWHELELLWKREPHLRKCPSHIFLVQVCIFLWRRIDEGMPRVLWAVPPQGRKLSVLHLRRLNKPGCEQHTCMDSAPAHAFACRPWLPWMMDYNLQSNTNPFLHRLLFVMIIIIVIEILPRTRPESNRISGGALAYKYVSHNGVVIDPFPQPFFFSMFFLVVE